MNSSRCTLRMSGLTVLCIVIFSIFMVALHRKDIVHAQIAPQPSPGNGKELIVPNQEDLTREITGKIKYFNRDKEPTSSFLLPLPEWINSANTLGGGWRGKDMWIDNSSIPAGGGVPDRSWGMTIRYLVYRSPSDARKHWKTERDRQLGYEAGTFTGKVFGDESGHISQPEFGLYELHVVRSNVSINLSSRVMVFPQAKAETDITDFRTSVETAMEITALAIVKRIDGVVKAKGRVDMSNLPPVRVKPVTQTG